MDLDSFKVRSAIFAEFASKNFGSGKLKSLHQDSAVSLCMSGSQPSAATGIAISRIAAVVRPSFLSAFFG
jgi:hypothetical protein